MSDQEKQKPKVTRRSFLKGSAAVGATGLLAASTRALAGSPSGQLGAKGLKLAAVRQLDEYPFETSGMSRYSMAKGLVPVLTAYKQLVKNAVAKVNAGDVTGWSKKDWALSHAANILEKTKELMSWKGSNQTAGAGWPPLDQYVQMVGRWEGSPDEASIAVKKAARVLGAADVGIATLNKLWFYSHDMANRPITFEDVAEPVEAPEKVVIPNSMRWVVVCAVPMNQELLEVGPGAGGMSAVYHGYSMAAAAAVFTAHFIRGLGYLAWPLVQDLALNVPLAIEAGLGEQSRISTAIHPVMGTCFRTSKVLTNLPLVPDRPISFGAKEFCKVCKKCAEACPSGAITLESDYIDPPSDMNNGGTKRWYADGRKCAQYWGDGGVSCSRCILACPYNKPQTWIHDVVKGVTTTTPAFDRLFVSLDKAMGYGGFGPSEVEAKFWDSEEWPIGQTETRRVFGEGGKAPALPPSSLAGIARPGYGASGQGRGEG